MGLNREATVFDRTPWWSQTIWLLQSHFKSDKIFSLTEMDPAKMTAKENEINRSMDITGTHKNVINVQCSSLCVQVETAPPCFASSRVRFTEHMLHRLEGFANKKGSMWRLSWIVHRMHSLLLKETMPANRVNTRLAGMVSWIGFGVLGPYRQPYLHYPDKVQTLIVTVFGLSWFRIVCLVLLDWVAGVQGIIYDSEYRWGFQKTDNYSDFMNFRWIAQADNQSRQSCYHGVTFR